GSSDQHDRMEGTLLACANGPPALGAQLQEGKLEKDLPRPGFGDLSALEAGPAAPAAAPRPAAVTRIDESAEERRAQRELERLRTEAEHRAREAAKGLA